jgi:pyruvate/2-oxoglutarate dehydrogenase complex dihydrolipoamide dehydrogenase (E3) component
VAVNSLFSPFYKKKVNYKTIPRVTFTDPEVASVGKEAYQLETEGVDYMTTYYELKESDRAICESETEGFVKVITKGKTDEILGATIVSPVAGEMLTEITFAMNHNMGLNSIMGTIHPYPTWSEANKGLAGVWKNKTKPEKVIEKLKGFHKFRR